MPRRNRAVSGVIAIACALALAGASLTAPAAASTGTATASTATAGPTADPPAGARYRDDQLVVRFAHGVPDAATLARLGVTVDRELLRGRAHVVRTAPGDAVTARERLLADPAVAAADLDYVRTGAGAPNDPQYASQAPALNGIRLERAWERAPTRGAGVRIAVVDTGLTNHADLFGRVEAPGYNVLDGTSNVTDTDGHGTRVASIIAANTNNALGMAGVAGGATIVPIKVATSAAAGASDSELLDAIDYAAWTESVDIIHVSFAGPGDSDLMQWAVEEARTAGAVVIAAAGNGSSRTQQYPAATDNVVGVAAVDPAAGDAPAAFSNRGNWVTLAAPGVGIRTTADGVTFGAVSGTSYAAAVVTGIAALTLGREPALTVEQLEARLRDATRDRGAAGHDAHYGFGVVDALAAVGGPTVAPAPLPTDATPGNDTPGDTYDRADAFTAPAVGGSISVPQPARIDSAADEDWYRVNAFNGNNLGGTWRVQLTPPPNVGGKGMTARVEIYTGPGASPPMYRVLGVTAAGPGAGIDTTVQFQAAPAGNYRIRVLDAADAYGFGNYSLTLTYQSAGNPTITPVLDRTAWIRDTSVSNNEVLASGPNTITVTFGRRVELWQDTNFRFDLVNQDGVTLAQYDDTEQTFQFVPDVNYEYALSGRLDPPGASLPAGAYTVRVRNLADDMINVLEDWSFGFVVGSGYGADQTAPATTVTGAPASVTTSSVAVLAFSSNEAGSTFQCRLDAGAWQSCTSPKSYTVGAGAHTFSVFARDPAGNEDATPATASWTYAPPAASVPGAPGGVSVTRPASGQLRISWHAAASNGSTITKYTATLNPGNRKIAVSGAGRSATFTGLMPGASYSLSVRATNGVGTGPSSATVVGVASFPPYTYTARYTTEEIGLLQRAGRHFGIPASEVPEAGVSALAYITGLSGGGPRPIVPPPANNAPNKVYTTWTASTVFFPQTVASYFALNMDQAHFVGGAFMIYVTILQGG